MTGQLHPLVVRDIAVGVIGRSQQRGISPADILDRHHLANDLGFDPQDRLELFSALEVRFGVDFSEEEMAAYSTVGALVDSIAAKLREEG